jgi:hypothetical protein
MNWRNPSDDALLPLRQARQGFDPAPRHLDPLNLEVRNHLHQPLGPIGNEYGPLPKVPLRPVDPISPLNVPPGPGPVHDGVWSTQPQSTPVLNEPGNDNDGPSEQQQQVWKIEDDVRRSRQFSTTYDLGLERERRQENEMSFCEQRTSELVGRIASRYEEPEETEKRNMDKTFWEGLMEEQDREFNEMFP